MKTRFAFYLFCVYQTLGCIREENASSGYFRITQDFRLAGHVMRITSTDSFLNCAQFCLREQRCASFNYKDNFGKKGVCELNSKKASTKFALIYDDNYNYATMECEISMNVDKSQVKSLLFPVASTTNYVMLRHVITSPLAALTVCLWMRTNDTTNEGTPFSYSAEGNGGHQNEFYIYNYNKFEISVNNYYGKTNVTASDDKWHHICTTWESTSGSWAFYKDGQTKAQGTGLQTGYKIKHGGVIVLGQEQDSDGGSFMTFQSFIGEMTNVNIWSRVLTAQDILRMGSSCADGSGDVMQWSIAIGNQTGDDVKEVSPASCN